jgi:membrane fusion protein, copper/silver efflux system
VVASGPFLIDSEASLQGLVPAPNASAAQGSEQSAAPAASSAQARFAMYEGRGRITDLSADIVELQHEAIPALKWSAMTMSFAVASGAMPRAMKVGDEVRFRFTMGDDGPVIQSMQLISPRKGGQP